MTELLEKAIAQLKMLPDEEQDVIATRLLAEIEDEQQWKAQFEATKDDQWDRMADLVGSEITAGGVTPLDEVFSIQPEHEVKRSGGDVPLRLEVV